MDYQMGKERKHGMTLMKSMKVSGRMGKDMGKGNILTVKEENTLENGRMD